jgi:hypothetical protein
VSAAIAPVRLLAHVMSHTIPMCPWNSSALAPSGRGRAAAASFAALMSRLLGRDVEKDGFGDGFGDGWIGLWDRDQEARGNGRRLHAFIAGQRIAANAVGHACIITCTCLICSL